MLLGGKGFQAVNIVGWAKSPAGANDIAHWARATLPTRSSRRARTAWAKGRERQRKLHDTANAPLPTLQSVVFAELVVASRYRIPLALCRASALAALAVAHPRRRAPIWDLKVGAPITAHP